ncbi:uncharacterized protein [Montipora capricornis]|uniref:uncharacterized protein n=1 Tax=Montipora capricornis TaxID=246305 RepID=UPI0035F15780
MLGMDETLDSFLSWCNVNGLRLSDKVKVSLQGSCHRYGMIAVDNIKKGECLFEIPRSLLLKPESSSISGILENLTYKSRIALNRRSGWTPLLLALMYEYTNPTSHWKPYLNLVPDVTVLDQPYFWGEDELWKELKGIEILKDVERDIQLIEEEYKCIALPFIKKHPNYFSESCHTLDLYKHMAAFVMAYSFTEKSDYDSDSDSNFSAGAPAPVMVPMADILNHISKNNAHLEFGRETLTMVAVQDIFEGQEVFNTYGELSNCDLLQSYGFVENELPNKYDVVDIPLAAFHEVMKANQPLKATQLLNAKFEFIRQMDVMSDDDMFHFGREGCSHFSPDLYLLLRILHLSITEFKQLLEEQVQAQRSETFDDIVPLLNQTDNQADEEMRRGASQRILELVLKAEKENFKEKRVGNGKNSEETNKKQKLESGSDEELEDLKCTSEIKLSPASNGCTEKLVDIVPPWYSPIKPKPVYESADAQAFWDVLLYADHMVVRANRIDAKVVDHKRKNVTILEMSCPWVDNRAAKDQDKTEKYAPLRLELKQQFKGYSIDQHNIILDAEVDIPLAAFHEVMKANQPLKATQLLNAKFEFIRQMDVMSDDDMFHFGREGCSHFSPDLYLLLRILHLSITEFKQLLEEQIQAQRSETFDDIVPLLNQTDNQADEEMRRGASQRILELVLKAEKENLKEKRVGNGKNSEETNKKQKLESGSDEELEDLKCTSEIKLSPASNGCTETFNTRCENESNVVGVGGADCHPIVEGDLTIINGGENGSRTSNKEISEEEKMCTGKERSNYEYDQDDAVGDNKHDDDDDDDDDYDSIDIDDDDGDNFNDNGEVVEDEKGADEAEEEEEEESDQTLTYDLLSQWPLEWRRTLRSVAQLCVKQRFGEDKLDGDVSEDGKLSKRQLSVLRIRRGQRYIFQQICGLVDQTALPVAETTFLF